MRLGSIKNIYKNYYKQFYISGKVPVKDTKLGMWGVSSADDCFEIFDKLKICGSFIDLGSGDGKVVMIASLFCDSVAGAECDAELVSVSRDFAQKLGIKSLFNCEDYMDVSLDGYDWLFLNPDHDLDELEKKLIKEMKGKVIVYSNLYFFKNLKKVEEFEVSGIKVIVYSR